MKLAPLPLSYSVIDLRAMLHLMPDQYQSAIYHARLDGALTGAVMALAITWFSLLALMIWSRKQ